jgi:putative membrane protein
MKSDIELSPLFSGALAGLMATGPMTAVMLILHRLLPWWERYELPPTEITERATEKVGLDLDNTALQAVSTAAHISYGAVVGALYAPLLQRLPFPGLAKGIVYGLAVWFISYLGLMPGLGVIEPAVKQPAQRNILMIIAHVVWGMVLGMGVDFLRSRRTGPDHMAVRS